MQEYTREDTIKCGRKSRSGMIVPNDWQPLTWNLEDNPILSRLGVRAVIDKFRGYRRAMTVMELPTDKWDGLLFPILFRKLRTKRSLITIEQ